MFSAKLIRKDIYGQTRLQEVYIIQTTLLIYISSEYKAKHFVWF
jgi:hypothetical protein